MSLLERLTRALEGRYSVEREIGAGGMATVYLALDVKHNRNVALKVLRPELAATLGSDRFLHEIEIAAALQHPHILPLLDSGDADGFLYYVMPFIEGQTLREKLEREGELPVPSAIRIITEVVDALSEAHRLGVIHRDIKPENVLITGRHALVADFGVAKAVNEATGRHKLTTAGVALGTPAYMAPEQALAEPNIDQRVDIYAVGAMLYEMLTGRPPFSNGTAQQILSAHMTQQPDPVVRHRSTVSPELDAVVMKCLEKHPADRYQNAGELLDALEPLASTPSGGVTPTTTRPVKGVRPTEKRDGRSVGALVAGGLVLLVVAVAATAMLTRHREEHIEFGPVVRLTNDPGLEIHPALSADGKFLAYAAGPIGAMRIYVRSISGGSPILVAKDVMVNQSRPQWSPDGSRLLFAGGSAIYMVPSLGGPSRVVVENATEPAWSPDGREIAYVVHDTLFAQPAEGGARRAITTALELTAPAWSPDGTLVAFVSTNVQYATSSSTMGNIAPSFLMVAKVSGGVPVKLTGRRFLNMSPSWLDRSHLLYMSTMNGGRDLYSIEVDGSGNPQGTPARLTTGLDIGTFALGGGGGQVAYSSFSNTSNVWAIPLLAERVATESDAKQVTRGTQHIEGVAVSRDGKQLAFDSDRQGNSNIFVMPIEGGEPRQVSNDPSFAFVPSWSADGTEIAFHSWRNESRDIYAVAATGGEEHLVAGGPSMEMYPDWSSDGKAIVFQSDRAGLPLRLFITDRGADGRWGPPRQLTQGYAQYGRWSPDGRQIAYVGTGVSTISPAGGAPRILLDRAHWPLPNGLPTFTIWSPDSRTIYFKEINRSGAASFWAIPADGGTPRAVARFSDPSFAASRQEFATDGKRLFFTVDDRESDIKVMTLSRKR